MSKNGVQISFEGNIQQFIGTFVRRNKWQALKKGAFAWGICWALSLLFMFVPYVNVSVFLVFIPLGPMVMAAIYFISKRAITSIDGSMLCLKCEKTVSIKERDVAPPIYEHCPYCKAGFEILVPPAT